MKTDRREIVECLLTANYSESEIIDYLTGPLGLTDDEAWRAVHEVAGVFPFGAAAGGQLNEA